MAVPVTKNLGIIKAIEVGTVAPTNTNMIWFDTVNSVHKSYDSDITTWIEIGSGKLAGYPVDVTGLADGSILVFNDLDNKWEVKNPGELAFDYLDLNNNIANPTHLEGRLFYDKDKKALSYYNEDTEMTVNIGQENIIRVYNATLSTIANGKVVHLSDNFNGFPTVELANARVKNKSRLVGITTTTIPSGEYGYVTNFGSVTMDTSSYTLDSLLYLANTDGDLTPTRPDDGSFAVIMGIVAEVGVTGKFLVDIIVSDLTVEVTNNNGFPPDQRDNTTLSVDAVNHTFTIAPITPGGMFHYYVLGEKYEQYAPVIMPFDNLQEGNHWFFFTGQEYTVLVNPDSAQIKDVILKYAFIASIYWNAIDQKVEVDIFDERHGSGMNPVTHYYLHRTQGAKHISGFNLEQFNFVGLGNDLTGANNKFAITEGEYVDEDISHLGVDIPINTTIPVAYILNNTTVPTLRTKSLTDYAIAFGTNGIQYNQLNLGLWQLTEVTNNKYCLYHIFGINGQTQRHLSVMGQTEYSSISAARLGANTEISALKYGIALAEIIPLGTIIYQSRHTPITSTLVAWSKPASTVVTVTLANHGLVVDESIVISASTVTNRLANGTYIVQTVPTDNTFTITGQTNTASSGTATVAISAFASPTKSRIVRNDNGTEYIDWSTTELAQGGSPTSHAGLTDVEQAGLGISQGHIGTGAQTIYGDKTFEGNTTFNGNIIQNGAAYETHAEQIYTEKDFIIMRDGLTVVGLPDGSYSGFQFNKYDADLNTGYLAIDNKGYIQVGDAGSLQIVATRNSDINMATDTAIPYWNLAAKRFDTNANVLISGNNIQAATILLTNLTDGYIPYHINDTSGLANSVIFQTAATKLGFGTNTPTEKYEFITDTSGMLVLANSAADVTNKNARFAIKHYNITEEPVGIILGQSTSAANVVLIGGGSSFVNTATEISFYTAANNTTVSGTLRGQINSAGNWGVGGAVIGTYKLGVAGTVYSDTSYNLKGSGTGVTTISSANSSATNYTLSLPAENGTFVTHFNGKINIQSATNDLGLTFINQASAGKSELYVAAGTSGANQMTIGSYGSTYSDATRADKNVIYPGSGILTVIGGLQVSNVSAAASASNVGTFRYRTDASNSYVDMSMQLSNAPLYGWVNIKTYTY